MPDFRIVIEGFCDAVPGQWHGPEDFLRYYTRDTERFPDGYNITVKMEHKSIAGIARSRAALALYNYRRHIKTCKTCIGNEATFSAATRDGCETERTLRIWSAIFEREANYANEIVARNGG